MATPPVTALNAVAPADVHSSRLSPAAEGEDITDFGAALVNEIALIVSDTKSVPVDLAAAGVAAPTATEGAQSERIEMLEAILESTNVLAPATGPAGIESAQALEQASAPPATDTPKLAALMPAMQEAPQAAPTPAGVETIVETVVRTPRADAPAMQVQMAAAKPAAGQTATAAVVSTPAATVPAATSEPAAEAPAAVRRNPAETGLASATQAGDDPRESPEPEAPLGVDDRVQRHVERASERPRFEPPLAAAVAERVPGAEPMTPNRDLASPMDTLSSAAMVSRWTPTAHTSATDGPPAPATARIETPVGAAGWSDAFRQKIVWLVDRQQQSAELHVNPPNLGPVEVVLNIGGDGASIAFCSPHAGVREAIEASIADLRTALAERGLALGEALVSADPGTAREQLREETLRSRQRLGGSTEDVISDTETQRRQPVRRGLVDVFA